MGVEKVPVAARPSFGRGGNGTAGGEDGASMKDESFRNSLEHELQEEQRLRVSKYEARMQAEGRPATVYSHHGGKPCWSFGRQASDVTRHAAR